MYLLDLTSKETFKKSSNSYKIRKLSKEEWKIISLDSKCFISIHQFSSEINFFGQNHGWFDEIGYGTSPCALVVIWISFNKLFI